MAFDGLDATVEFGATFREQETCLRKGSWFVNHGSYGICPKRIVSLQKGYQDLMEKHPDDWFRRKALNLWNESTSAVADFLHCSSEDLVFVTNATTGINTVLKSYPFKPGNAILATCLTYQAIKNTCTAVASMTEGVEAYFLDIKFPITSEDQIVNLYEDFLKLHPNITIAVVDYITSPTAVLMPVKRIIDVCHQYNVIVVVDGAHAPGQLPVNLDDLGADIFTGNLHKWVFAPRGCAVLHVNKKHQHWVQPLVTSWNMGMDMTLQFFNMGTRDHSPYFSAKHAVEFFGKIGGLERISAYNTKIVTEARDYLVKLLKVEPLPIPSKMEAPYMKIIELPDVEGYENTHIGTHKLQDDIFNKYDIQVATVNVEGTGKLYLRLSAQVYNTFEDYKKLGEVLQTIIKSLK